MCMNVHESRLYTNYDSKSAGTEIASPHVRSSLNGTVRFSPPLSISHYNSLDVVKSKTLARGLPKMNSIVNMKYVIEFVEQEDEEHLLEVPKEI